MSPAKVGDRVRHADFPEREGEVIALDMDGTRMALVLWDECLGPVGGDGGQPRHYPRDGASAQRMQSYEVVGVSVLPVEPVCWQPSAIVGGEDAAWPGLHLHSGPHGWSVHGPMGFSAGGNVDGIEAARRTVEAVARAWLAAAKGGG